MNILQGIVRPLVRQTHALIRDPLHYVVGFAPKVAT